jgi:hypothetical protein
MKKILTILILLLSLAAYPVTVYIDPSQHSTGENGTKQHPFDSWTDVSLTNGNVYLQKRGTTYTSPTQIYVNDHSVTIGAYGSGNRPIFSYTGTSYAIRINASYCSISGLEINGNGSAFALIGSSGSTGEYWQHNKIDNCLLHNAHNPNNAGFGVHASYNSGLKILNTEIRNVAVDGIYLAYTPNIEIGYCNVHDVNRRYLINVDQKYSSGDGIQFDGNYNGFKLHHTTVDRTNGCGNKFNVIFASKVGVSNTATGVIEYCTFRTDANVTTAVDIEMGRGIITRYNRFEGVTQGIRLGGAYTSNNLIHNNEFTNCSSGVGVGYKYPKVGPATGTKVYNNQFKNTRTYHIWVDKAAVEVCGNTTDGVGTPQYNYGGGSFNTVTCK